MPNPQPVNDNLHADDEISLAEIGQALWSRRITIAVSTFVAGALSVVIALSMKPIFQAEVVLSPISSSGSGNGLSSITAQLGGLASLAGVNVSGGDASAESVATLNSRALIEQYIRSQNLMPVLYADSWDAEKNAWKQDIKKPPTLWFGTKKFIESILVVETNKKTGLINLKIQWTDAALAAQWANDLVSLTNERLRNRAISESTKSIAYLYQQLEGTSVIGVREAIYRLLEAETKKVMLAQGSNEYAFKVIDPAVMPEKKSKPRRALIVVMGTFIGFFLSAIYALVSPRRTPAI